MTLKTKRGLGRGLSSLLGEEALEVNTGSETKAIKEVPIEFLYPGSYQPRKYMDDEAIKELAASIKQKGILLPLLVRPNQEEPNSYEIIAGERRWRAAQLAKIHKVPIIIKKLNDKEVFEVALIENLQRKDLLPLEEAEGYQKLMHDFSHTQEGLAKVVGKSRSHVANMMRLTGLPLSIKEMLNSGKISIGHARALLNSDDPIKIAKKIIEDALNVRQTEKLAQQDSNKKLNTKKNIQKIKDSNILKLENDLSLLLGLKTEIKFNENKGVLIIHYKDLDQLDKILLRLRDKTSTSL